MAMPAALRKAALTTHVVASGGWLGAVVAFLGLAVSGVTAQDPATVRAMSLAMETLGVAVLVPLSLASFASGLVQSLGTSWGLLRHYWVVVDLSLTVLATAVLLLYASILRVLGAAARSPSLADDRGVLPSWSPVLHAGGAIAVLLAAAVLSVYKPRGLTRYGWRKQQRQRTGTAQDATSA